MQGLIGAIVAAFAGIVVGFWLRGASAKAEKMQLQQRADELAAQLAAGRTELEKVQAESAGRAGFESLAAERQNTIAQMAAEREALRADLASRAAVEAQALAQVSGLRAELKAERAALAEKLALLESAKQTLANQFEALAGKILDEKSKSFSEGSQKELGTLLTPLKTQESRRSAERLQNRRGQARRPHRQPGQPQFATGRRSKEPYLCIARLRQGTGRLGRIHPARPA
jgi:DNA recombination protein RmuC